MKNIIYIIVIFSFLYIVGGMRISFKPFHFEMPMWRVFVGWLFVGFGVFLIIFHHKKVEYKNGFEKGVSVGTETIIDKIKEKLKDKEKDYKYTQSTIEVMEGSIKNTNDSSFK